MIFGNSIIGLSGRNSGQNLWHPGEDRTDFCYYHYRQWPIKKIIYSCLSTIHLYADDLLKAHVFMHDHRDGKATSLNQLFIALYNGTTCLVFCLVNPCLWWENI